MRIDSSYVGMESKRNYASTRRDANFYSAWNQNGDSMKFNANLFQNNEEGDVSKSKSETTSAGDRLRDNSDSIMNKFKEMRTLASKEFKTDKDNQAKIKTDCMNYLLQILFGKKMKTEPFEGINLSSAGGNGSGGTYTESSYYSESENVSFSTEGKVVTADGEEISFQLELSMSRKFESYYEESFSYGSALCDPLVINLNSKVASVSDQKFLFDIDGDGTKDNISKLGSGSGFLALDKNGDGVINDGNELFGTKSGDGFRDLSEYDSDKNGWIDENDDIFDKLRIWTKDENGKDKLYKLSEKGVGAMYLGNAATNFSLNNAVTNDINAVIRKTGIFLFENKEVGTLQHVDMATT